MRQTLDPTPKPVVTCRGIDVGHNRPNNGTLIGDSGTGKSHLLIGLGTAAAAEGYRVRYILATKLVNELVEAADERLAKTIARYGRVDLLCKRISAARPRPSTEVSRRYGQGARAWGKRRGDQAKAANATRGRVPCRRRVWPGSTPTSHSPEMDECPSGVRGLVQENRQQGRAC